MITNLYVDGFSLYCRALKDTPFRWLDLGKLAETCVWQSDTGPGRTGAAAVLRGAARTGTYNR